MNVKMISAVLGLCAFCVLMIYSFFVFFTSSSPPEPGNSHGTGWTTVADTSWWYYGKIDSVHVWDVTDLTQSTINNSDSGYISISHTHGPGRYDIEGRVREMQKERFAATMDTIEGRGDLAAADTLLAAWRRLEVAR